MGEEADLHLWKLMPMGISFCEDCYFQSVYNLSMYAHIKYIPVQNICIFTFQRIFCTLFKGRGANLENKGHLWIRHNRISQKQCFSKSSIMDILDGKIPHCGRHSCALQAA